MPSVPAACTSKAIGQQRDMITCCCATIRPPASTFLWISRRRFIAAVPSYHLQLVQARSTNDICPVGMPSDTPSLPMVFKGISAHALIADISAVLKAHFYYSAMAKRSHGESLSDRAYFAPPAGRWGHNGLPLPPFIFTPGMRFIETVFKPLRHNPYRHLPSDRVVQFAQQGFPVA